MRIRNTTNVSRETIADVIRFVRPAGISNFRVRIGNTSRAGYGRATRISHNVTVFIARTDKDARGRFHRKKGRGYLPNIVVGNRIECLVVIMAHELRHVWQGGHTRGRVWGSRGRYSERDADAYALSMLRHWRRR